MSPNGFYVYSRLPAWNRGISHRARTGFELASPCRELITSVPHRPPEKGASIQFQGSRTLRFSHGARTEQVSVAPVGGCCGGNIRSNTGNSSGLSASPQPENQLFHARGKRFELKVIIHKMAASPVQAGNATICA